MNAKPTSAALAVEQIATALAALGLALAASSFFVPSMAGVVAPFRETYFFLMEFLFWGLVTNAAMLGVSAALIALAVVVGIFRGKSIIRDNAAWRAVAEIIWAFLCFLALLAQIYVLGFAALTHPLILAFALAGYFAARFYLRKKSPATAEEPLGVPLAYVVVFVVLHLFLEMVPGHLATPAVHAVAKYFGALSRSQPFIYYAVMALVPFVFLFAGGPRMRRCIRINTKAAAALAVLFVLMLVARFSFIGLVAALGVAVVFLSDLHRQPLRASVDPRSLVDRVMPFAIPALAIVFGHYASFTWNCARARDLPDGIRRISERAGAFDFAMSADGRTLLASLREEQRVLAVDLDAGTSRGILNTQALVDGERRFLSWVEPENLVRLGGDDRFLLLAAVSDNEEENRVAEINASGDILRLVDAIPRTGVSDIVRDGQGRVYLSTEFEDKIFVLDETTLERVNEIAWPGAETNRVIVRPDRIFSLGLWWDGRVRVFDFTAKRETGSADVGTRSWDLAYDDATNRLYIPKMIAGNLLVVDAATMVLEARRRVGFGARPIEIDARRRRLLLGNMYDGRFTAYDLDTGDLVFETRLGGYLKGMIVDEKRGKAYTGCACGIFEIDLDVIG